MLFLLRGLWKSQELFFKFNSVMRKVLRFKTRTEKQHLSVKYKRNGRHSRQLIDRKVSIF